MQSYTNLNQSKMKSVENFVEKNNYQINKTNNKSTDSNVFLF